ncbi:hypothetical protein FRAHR75_430020 [Frankia sp. Hr75.2]|nr:hypothetical protein FRAHR75_430020 [Frankia sp. Hr75.2]
MDPRRQSITRSHRKSNRRHPRQTASTSRAAHRARQPHRLHGLENRASASLNQPHPTPVSSPSVCLPASTVRPAHSPALDPRPRPDPITRPWPWTHRDRVAKATEARAGLDFPHAVQAVQITRRRRPHTGGPERTTSPAATGPSRCDMRSHCVSQLTELEGRISTVSCE